MCWLGEEIGSFYAMTAAVPESATGSDSDPPTWAPRWLRRLAGIEPEIRNDAVRGWRMWRVYWDDAAQDWFLYSAATEQCWPTGRGWDSGRPSSESRLRGLLMDNYTPGYHSFKSRSDAVELSGWTPRERGSFCAIGQVEVAGYVTEHELGYRAQGVCVKHLELPVRGSPVSGRAKGLMGSLQSRYQCDVYGFIVTDFERLRSAPEIDFLTPAS